MAARLKSRRSSARKPPHAVATPRTVLYLYAISRNGDFRISQPGVDGSSSVEPLACSGLICWISRVAHREFADQLEERMQDLDWLAAAGVRHQQAVAAIASQSDVLPARFATIFVTPDSLERHIRDQKPVLLAALERIAGCDEWGVKVHVVPNTEAGAGKQSRNKEIARSGREYLERKAATLQARPAKSDPVFDEFANELGRHSREAARVSTQGALPGLEWQASFLVPRRQREAFLATTSRYAERWHDQHRIECTGPWPPYSFVASLGSDTAGGRQR